jgi:hypothetical protein
MAGFSTYAARAVLNHIFRTASFTKPTNVYISLHGSDPTDANLTATELTIGTGAYARVAVTVADASWNAPSTSGGVEQITNASNITFPDPTGADWNSGNPVTYAGIYDAPTGGNLLASGALTTPRVILIADSNPVFGPGALVFTLA